MPYAFPNRKYGLLNYAKAALEQRKVRNAIFCKLRP